MRPTRILLADDHQLVRAGFRSLLQAVPGFDVVAEADNGREALRLAEAHRPHVVLMDVLMPELNGLDATARLTAQLPAVRVVLLSVHANEEYVLQGLRAGAAGYLLKNSNPAELELAVRAVVRGDIYLSPEVARFVVTGYLQAVGSEAQSLVRLTPRQREVLQLIAEGHTTKAIARKLHLSVKTVEMHRTQLMKALDIHEIAGLVRYAIRKGLIAPDG